MIYLLSQNPNADEMLRKAGITANIRTDYLNPRNIGPDDIIFGDDTSVTVGFVKFVLHIGAKFFWLTEKGLEGYFKPLP